ncbi:hypothetical protein [Xenorhabdus hominickii]|uniref:Uncharacterized protein n=1 Tax=Xenorhabdus hominickii TaxID=351679 RepID=A0A1V0M4N4_XENHO|nr:hypothetical protein [Xenorhabdus hominickii]ARD69843.1 hypothetical protein [Xenorhabdus hominickii]PHM51881.1 hypothetical protein Xhom_04720 [Xenorhabdus hominickii]
MTTLIDTIQPPESYLETLLTEATGTKVCHILPHEFYCPIKGRIQIVSLFWGVVIAPLYLSERFENGVVYSADHILAVNDESDDTDPYLWFSNDEDMEMLIQRRGRL